MRRRSVLIFIGVVAVILALGVVWPRETEAARVEAETVAAIRKLELVRKNAVTSSPGLMVAMVLRHSKDPEGDYEREFERGMKRLLELGVLEKRNFALADTRARAELSQIAMSGFSKDLLWMIANETNGTVTVTAKPNEFPKWEALIESFRKNAGKGKVEVGKGG